ncbi:GNAT family N-acetyltransferase [Lutibacter holmesii]|uniref:GNAT family N-acetyltransferase n=1 Tax=Lutibacter holmesii TaxID=1137985 RepID=A0ABW3WP76_9FLAO
MNYTSFETERLILMPTTVRDAAFVLSLLNTPKWLQYIGDRNVKTVESAKDYINEKMMPQLERLGFSNYTLIRKQDQQKIGTCGLYDREGVDGFDIGFAFLPEFENKGYGFEAANRLKEAAFQEFGLTSLQAITSKENLGSQKLLQKLGLQLIGTLQLPNDPIVLLQYKIENNNVK